MVNRRLGMWFVLALLVACAPPDVPGDGAFAICGNGVCEAGESLALCPDDCGPCAVAPDCDDDEPCTADGCDPLFGCQHVAVAPAPCDAGPCREAGVCEAGSCQGDDKLWSFSVSAQPGGWDSAEGMAEDSNGDLVVVGNALQGVRNHDNFVVRLPRSGSDTAHPGTPVWIQADPNYDDLIFGMAKLAGDGFLTVGERRTQAAALQPNVQTWARWIVMDGPADTPHAYHMSFAGNHGLQAVARASDESLVAVGHVDNEGLAVRFSATGTPGWKRALAPTMAGGCELLDVAAVTAEAPQWLAVGRIEPTDGSPQRGWAVQLAGPATEVVWNETYSPPGGRSGLLLHVVTLQSGGAIALGATQDTPFFGGPPPETARVWWLRLNAEGQVVWQDIGSPGWFPLQLMHFPDHDEVLAFVGLGRAPYDLPNHIVARGLDGTERGISRGIKAFPNAMLGLADGTIAAAGVHGVAGQHDTWIARLDPWGNQSCVVSGSCADNPRLDCDDHNPCTADQCFAEGQCTHLPLQDGAGCDKDKVCKEGQCVP